jgi:SWI/SNF-related matrix-associated actin-dependent regulator of chromatin subfamily A-like protein 1
MLVDFTGTDFTLTFDRSGTMTAHEAMVERGMDFSRPDSTPDRAVFYTKEPWPVADLFANATPAAKAQLAPISNRIALSQAPDSGAHFKMPMDCELWGFQKASLEYCLSRNQSLIADAPGLGKTPMGIVYANEIGARRVLVICPAAIRKQWERRIKQWSTMRWPYLIYPVFNSKNGIHPTAEWVVISFALARNPALVAAIAKMNFDLCIIDESHYLKDGEASQTKAIYGQADGLYHWKRGEPALPSIVSRCAHVLCLSGTPIVNRPLEAYTTSRALCWDAIDYQSLDRFRQRYNPQKAIMLGGGKRATDEKIGRVRELGNRMRGMYMARHAKREVMTQLKMPRYEVIQVEETGEVKAALRSESLLGLDLDVLQTTNNYEVLGHIAQVRREMGIAVAPQAAEYVAVAIEGGEDKIVVFGWHIEVLDILQAKLTKYGVLRIDGSTSNNRRQQYVDTFIRDPHMKVMLGNIQSMGTGVDGLQEVATHCVLVEPSWTPGENQQAVDRLDRGGQKGHVQADFLVAPGSISEKILVAALNKAHTIEKVIG